LDDWVKASWFLAGKKAIMNRFWQTCKAQGIACLVSCMALIPAMAKAGPLGGHGHAGGPQAHAARQAQKEARREMREARANEAGTNETRGNEARSDAISPMRDAPEPGAQPARAGRRGRLTPEERRALRQQINEAGQGIYQSPPKN
jgi:hypothetical protein